ncbi:MAG TPA: EAL domain-containing protein [Steroidobacteraceae bacterium]|nr:EAL domain-containing protein [Steroidobacteraceae bacterium]
MIELTTEAWTLVLAACLGLLLSSTTLALALQSTIARSRGGICILLLSSLALGFGLWAMNFVQVLSVQIPGQPNSGISWPALTFAIAASGCACALLFLACREPDTAGITGSAFALAIGIEATHCAAFDEPLGELVTHQGLPWVSVSFLLVFVALLAALWIWLKLRRDRSWKARGARALAVLAGAMGILGTNAHTLAQARWLFDACCEDLASTRGLQMVAVAALAGAVLAIAQVVAIFSDAHSERAARNARELAEVHARLQYLATHDSLTGLPNRQRFKDRLNKAIADTERHGRAIAVAVFDLDHFSAINHSLGHGVGDWLLTEVSRRVTGVISSSTTLARLDGDEFAVLIDNVAARLEAQTVATAILTAFEEPLRINGMEVSLRSTIGLSVWPDDGRRCDDLLDHAEVAMAIAKERGGGQSLFFQPAMTHSLHERLALENDLRRALAAEEFELYYQPEISAKTGKIAAAEALLRWRHPTKGLLAPSSFITLAEETGLMIPLGEWVLREACRQARAWQLELGCTFPVAVNLSATQFRHQNILQMIHSALTDAGLDARALEIELTESALMTNPEESAGVLKQLRKMGISVAIDDFGTGYSSLSYLRRFPIDKLKIDRSFIRDLTISRTDESIVRAIVSLARSVGLKVVAEGIESVEQLEFVTRLECDQWQGYHCCKPQPAARFEAMLEDQNGTRTGIVAALAALVARGADS